MEYHIDNIEIGWDLIWDVVYTFVHPIMAMLDIKIPTRYGAPVRER